jgi:hypothetical protein
MVLVALSLASCGTQKPQTAHDGSGVDGQVQLGPQCPVQTEASRCKNQPAVGAKVTVATQEPGLPEASGKVVARATTDANGNYHVAVQPGTYVVTAQSGMSCELMKARVTSGVYSTVDIVCDTGIR